MEKLGLATLAGIVYIFCIATAIASAAPIFTTLLNFDRSDGNFPYGGLVQGTDGNFYGTTGQGGANNNGTVFKITPGGTLTTLHSFDGIDGNRPAAGLVQATNGNFYGTTELGGKLRQCRHGCGTVFKITPEGTLTRLHGFCAQPNCTDGDSPVAGLVQATNGNFYGTTLGGAPAVSSAMARCSKSPPGVH